MKIDKKKKHIAILGGGPSGMFAYKQLIGASQPDLVIDIFEKKNLLGAGMPYSFDGANAEHITNVSGNEIPHLVTSVEEWIQNVPAEILAQFNINPSKFNDFKVLPRLLFGQYLSAQFDLLHEQAGKAGIQTNMHLECTAIDIIDKPETDTVCIVTDTIGRLEFDCVIICTGHNWPKKYEGLIPGYFDAPYPPAKLALNINHEVAIKGSSLTAIDAIRTLARQNGKFYEDSQGKLQFKYSEGRDNFKMTVHSRSGLLPAVRFHLEDSHLSNDKLLAPEEIAEHMAQNDGYLSLDYVFAQDFKEPLREKRPEFYERIRHMNIEQFVAAMMELRERLDPFQLLKAEYAEAGKSIRRQESVYWKEMLAVLSFAMNYPAKHLSAEDMQRLQSTLMPLISLVIAFIPQRSCEELIALHDCGILDIIAVGSDSTVEPVKSGGAIYHFTDENGKSNDRYYKTFVDCVGQPHLLYEDVPFKSLVAHKVISPARLKFRDADKGRKQLEEGDQAVEADKNGSYYLKVSGIAINDRFQIIDQYGAFNERIYMMAVPYIGGFNPDYSGLDFCEAASAAIVGAIMEIAT